MKLWRSLSEEHWGELRSGKLHWWVAPEGLVVCTDPATKTTGSGRSIGQAHEALQKRLKSHV